MERGSHCLPWPQRSPSCSGRRDRIDVGPRGGGRARSLYATPPSPPPPPPGFER